MTGGVVGSCRWLVPRSCVRRENIVIYDIRARGGEGVMQETSISMIRRRWDVSAGGGGQVLGNVFDHRDMYEGCWDQRRFWVTDGTTDYHLRGVILMSWMRAVIPKQVGSFELLTGGPIHYLRDHTKQEAQKPRVIPTCKVKWFFLNPIVK